MFRLFPSDLKISIYLFNYYYYFFGWGDCVIGNQMSNSFDPDGSLGGKFGMPSAGQKQRRCLRS